LTLNKDNKILKHKNYLIYTVNHHNWALAALE